MLVQEVAQRKHDGDADDAEDHAPCRCLVLRIDRALRVVHLDEYLIGNGVCTVFATRQKQNRPGRPEHVDRRHDDKRRHGRPDQRQNNNK